MRKVNAVLSTKRGPGHLRLRVKSQWPLLVELIKTWVYSKIGFQVWLGTLFQS